MRSHRKKKLVQGFRKLLKEVEGNARVARTVIVKSVKMPRKLFRVFVELEGMYRNMLEQLVLYASRNVIRSFTKLKAQKYRELRSMYPHLPSHCAYTVCQDVATRVRSFYKSKICELAEEVLDELQTISDAVLKSWVEKREATSIK